MTVTMSHTYNLLTYSEMGIMNLFSRLVCMNVCVLTKLKREQTGFTILAILIFDLNLCTYLHVWVCYQNFLLLFLTGF